MENTFSVKMIFHFYHSVVKAELKRRGFPKEVAKKIEEEHGKIVARAKDIGKSKLLSSYIMGSLRRRILRYSVTGFALQSFFTRSWVMWTVILTLRRCRGV